MHILICHCSVMKLIRIHEAETIAKLTDLAYEAFVNHASTLPQFPNQFHPGASHIEGVEFSFTHRREDIRLRVFDSVRNVILSLSEFGGRPDAQLMSFPDSIMNKIFHFEVIPLLLSDFEATDSNDKAVEVVLVPFSPLSQSFESPIKVILPLSKTMIEVYDYFLTILRFYENVSDSLKFKHTLEAVVLDDATKRPHILACDSSLVSCHLKHGQEIFVEADAEWIILGCAEVSLL